MTSIIEKIQKLQALAERAGTEHEATVAAIMTYEYFFASVEALLEGYLNEGGAASASDRRSFRIGCSVRIWEEAKKVSGASKVLLQGSTETQALVLFNNQLLVKFKKDKNLHAGSRASGARNSNAYAAGYQSGGRVDLHGARTSRMLAS